MVLETREGRGKAARALGRPGRESPGRFCPAVRALQGPLPCGATLGLHPSQGPSQTREVGRRLLLVDGAQTCSERRDESPWAVPPPPQRCTVAPGARARASPDLCPVRPCLALPGLCQPPTSRFQTCWESISQLSTAPTPLLGGSHPSLCWVPLTPAHEVPACLGQSPWAPWGPSDGCVPL